MKILLVGHACCPNLGSEPGLTWNWAWNLSRNHRVWLMVHEQWRREIEEFLAQNPNDNLHVEWVAVAPWMDPWTPKQGEVVPSYKLHLHYLLWQRQVYHQALLLHREHHFDVCHYVSWGTVSVSPLLWKLPVPFFWGPLGGAQTAPMAFREYLGEGWKREALRRIRVNFRKTMPSLRRVARASALVLATNCETESMLQDVGARHVSLFLDNGLPEEYVTSEVKAPRSSGQLRLHWSGRLEARKALPLALHALASVPNPNITLEISGEGPEKEHCVKMVDSMGIGDRVTFLGRIPRAQLMERFRSADVFLWTSLQDSFGSVLLEAMGQGLPVIGLDHQGVRAFVPSAASWKVPVADPTETVRAIAQAIANAAADAGGRQEKAAAALRFAASQTWPRRAARMEELYEDFRHTGRQFTVGEA